MYLTELIHFIRTVFLLARLTCILTLLCLSVAAQADVTTNDIARQFYPEEFSSLMVGEDSVPVINTQPTSAIQRGVAILLVDQGHMGLNMAAAKRLATRLNKWGWYTLISPTYLDNSGSSASETASTSRVEPMMSSAYPWLSFEGSQTQMTLLLNALYKHVENQKGFRLVITQGLTAAQLIALYSQPSETLARPDSLIVIAPFWPQRALNLAIPQQLANTDFPILDVSLENYNNWDRQTVLARREAATTSLKMYYRQRSIDAYGLTVNPYDDTNSPFVSWLASEIYGWVTYLGW